jgi:hypothetical protein
MNLKIKDTIKKLINDGQLPAEGLFDITEGLIESYIAIYGESSGNRYDRNYARKLAGLNLFKLKINERDIKFSLCKEGILYFITNTAWPKHVKIGITTDIDKRLATYQTGDPFRNYKVSHYEFVLDRHACEKQVKEIYSVNIENGEWLTDVIAKEVIEAMREKWKTSRGEFKKIRG